MEALTALREERPNAVTASSAAIERLFQTTILRSLRVAPLNVAEPQVRFSRPLNAEIRLLATQSTADQLAVEQQARAAAEQQAKQANDALIALQGKEDARGIVITLPGSVLFASNESTLLPDAQTRLATSRASTASTATSA